MPSVKKTTQSPRSRVEDLGGVGRQRGLEVDADRRRREQERALDARGPHDERRRVPGGGELKHAAPHADEREQRRHEALPAELAEHRVVELLQGRTRARRPRERAAAHGGAQRVLDDERGGEGVDALAGDVADDDREMGVGPAVEVDEVAAAAGAVAGGAVGDGDVQPGDLGRFERQQPLLEAVRDRRPGSGTGSRARARRERAPRGRRAPRGARRRAARGRRARRGRRAGGRRRTAARSGRGRRPRPAPAS